MSIKYTPNGIWEELKYAEERNEDKTSGYDALRAGYHTPYFNGHKPEIDGDSDGETGQWRADPENHAYEFASYVVPQFVAGNPRFTLASRRTDPEDEAHDEVKALEHALNQWIQDTDFRTAMDSVALDPLFAFGVWLVTPTKNKATYQQSLNQENWPEVQRISPRNFFRDPAALRFEESRYLGHRWVMESSELRAMAEADKDGGWDMDLIDDLEGVAMSEEYRPKSNTKGAPKRGEVELFEVWFPNRVFRKEPDEYPADTDKDAEPEPELTEKDGFHGTIYTLAIVRGGDDMPAEHGTSKFVRKPRAYYGHKSGPYAHCGMMRVPDDPWSLAPLVATQGQSRDLNALTRAQNEDIRSYKKLVFVTADDPDVATAVESESHRTVIPMKGLGNQRVADLVQAVEVGGPSAALQAAIELAHERLRRNSGMGEAQSGQAPGAGTTATAVAVASQDSQTRMRRMIEQWLRFLEDAALKVAFYIGTSSEVKITIDTKAVQELGGPPVPGEYQGGALTPADFEHMQITVDVTSVERTSEEAVQARLLQAAGMLMQSIPAVMQVPSMPFWSELFTMMGNTLNVPDMGKLGTSLVEGVLAVLNGDMPSLATAGTEETAPGVDASGGGSRSAPQRPAMPQMNGTGNRTPGMPAGVQQPVGLAGVGGMQ